MASFVKGLLLRRAEMSRAAFNELNSVRCCDNNKLNNRFCSPAFDYQVIAVALTLWLVYIFDGFVYFRSVLGL